MVNNCLSAIIGHGKEFKNQAVLQFLLSQEFEIKAEDVQNDVEEIEIRTGDLFLRKKMRYFAMSDYDGHPILSLNNIKKEQKTNGET